MKERAPEYNAARMKISEAFKNINQERGSPLEEKDLPVIKIYRDTRLIKGPDRFMFSPYLYNEKTNQWEFHVNTILLEAINKMKEEDADMIVREKKMRT